MSRANYLLSRISHARAPRLDAVNTGRLGIRSINVKLARVGRINTFLVAISFIRFFMLVGLLG